MILFTKTCQHPSHTVSASADASIRPTILNHHFLTAAILTLLAAVRLHAANFDITKFGATPDDGTDDTLAIRAALEACGKAGGGTIIVPRGVFIVSRQKSETPILSIPSMTTVRGTGHDSTLKFDAKVNGSNFWRMLGSTTESAEITIRDLHLDGANTHPGYVPGRTPEQNHGIFFYCKDGSIERVTVEDCLLENFSGDCVSFSQGCRGFTIRHVTVRNFLRQGIQMGGGKGDGGHLVTGCRDLEHTVRPGGTTIHVEHAEGGKGFRIEKNACRQSLLVGGGAEDLVVRDNDVTGRIEGNSIRNGLFENNRLAGQGRQVLMQFGYANGLVIRGNTIRSTTEAPGIYVWGASRYNPAPSKNITIERNTLDLPGQPISLNGVHGATVRGNQITGSKARNVVEAKRCEALTIEPSPNAATPGNQGTVNKF